MRTMFFAAALLCMAAAAASAQTPSLPPGTPIPGPSPLPGPTPRLLCTDLAIVGWNGSRSTPAGALADNEVAIYFQVRNNGPRAYTAPSDSTQWISIVLTTGSGDVELGVNVLPAASSGGPVSLAAGSSWRGHVRGTLPPGVTRARHGPARLQINYAGDGSAPLDCNLTNNRRSIVFR